MGWDRLMRKLILGVAGSGPATRLARRYGLKLGASRFVAGETLDQAIEAVRRLNGQGILATIDHLGESVYELGATGVALQACWDILDRIAETGVQANLSLKLTQLGLSVDAETAALNLERVLTRAERHGIFVRIDMEGSAYTQITLDLYRRMRRRFDQVGVVIQAYLYRSERDLSELAAMGANVRLVKGAYAEPPSIAFPNKADVDANFVKLADYYLGTGNYLAIATHDERVIEAAKRSIARLRLAPDRYEFQMLYGIREDLQRKLVAEGYRVRSYVPYGVDWYPYFTRRLAERPANLAFVLRNLLR